MYILGVNISHDASFCLLKDGEVVTYVEEERLTKKKHTPLLPDLKILSPQIIRRHTKKVDYLIISSFGWQCEAQVIRQLKETIESVGIEVKRLTYQPHHHLNHTACAFYNSGFPEAVSLVVDGAGQLYNSGTMMSRVFNGEGLDIELREIESIYDCSYDGFVNKFQHYSNRNFANDVKLQREGDIVLSSCMGSGWLFNLLSEKLGYGGDGAGKTMGLSAYGTSEDIDEQWFYYNEDVDHWVCDNDAFHYSVSHMKSGANVAKKLQEETREQTIKLIEKAVELTGKTNVVLSGGYFLNCVNNYEYIKRFPSLNIYVEPVSTDDGTAIGVAKFLWYHLTGDKTIRKQESLYWGEDIC